MRISGAPVQQLILRLRDAYSFRAGQYLQVQTPDDVLVPLSIASSPTRLPELELHYRSTPALAEAQAMDKLLSGTTLELTGPGGDVRSGAPGQPLFIVAGGSGAAQAFSCAEYRSSIGATAPITVLWCANKPEDIYQQDTLRGYANVELHTCIDDRRTADNEGLQWLAANCQHYRDAYVILAGGPGFVFAATDVLLQKGFLRSQLHADAYSYATGD